MDMPFVVIAVAGDGPEDSRVFARAADEEPARKLAAMVVAYGYAPVAHIAFLCDVVDVLHEDVRRAYPSMTRLQ